jgi:hypothetical protein
MVTMTAFASALALASLAATSFAAAADKRFCIDCIPGGGGGAGTQNSQDQGQGIPEGNSKKFQPDNFQNGQGQDQFKHRRAKTFEPNDQFQPGGNDNNVVIERHKKPNWPNDQFQQGGNDNNVVIERHKKPNWPNDQFQPGDNNNKYFDKHRSKQAWKFDSNRHERRRYKDKRFRFYFGGFWYPEPYWDEPWYDDDYVEYSRVSCREGADIVSERFDRVRILDCDGRIYTYLGRRYGDTFEIQLNSRTGRIIDAREI